MSWLGLEQNPEEAVSPTDWPLRETLFPHWASQKTLYRKNKEALDTSFESGLKRLGLQRKKVNSMVMADSTYH